MHGEQSNLIPPEFEPIRKLQDDREEAKQNSHKYFDNTRIRIDKNRKTHVFKEGDWAYAWSGNKLNRKKLDVIRSGPFKVVKRLSNSMYEIAHNKRGKTTTMYHSNKLIPAADVSLNPSSSS